MTPALSGIAIGIDLGTSGVRAVLVDRAGAALAFAAAPIAAARMRQPAAWWEGVGAALRALGQQADLSRVRAMAVDGTSGTVLAIAADGTPRGEASLYNDPAPADRVARIEHAAPAESGAHGATSPAAKFLAMQDGGLTRMLHQADWIAGQLCGRFDISDENNALKTGYDPVTRRWPDWLTEIGGRIALLPEVVAPGTAIGSVGDAVARALGLPGGIVLAAGTTDGCAAFLATGASAIGDAVTSLGTTLTLKQLSAVPLFAPEYGVYSHRLGDLWLAGGASNSGGGALLAHFSTEQLAILSAVIDPAADSGLDYYPLARSGERFPIADPTLAPRLTPRPADAAWFLHGMLEGIARIEALGYQRLRDLGGPPLASLRSVGGGARNPAWSALRARIIGAPLAQPRSEEAAVGTASLALAALRASSR